MCLPEAIDGRDSDSGGAVGFGLFGRRRPRPYQTRPGRGTPSIARTGATLFIVFVGITLCARGADCADQPANALAWAYDPTRPWYVEGLLGTVQPGPDATDLGSGQNYAAHLGFQMNRRSDLGLWLAWAHARATDEAIESNIVSGGVKARGWIGYGRWSPYADIGIGLYHLDVEQRNVSNPLTDQSLRLGGQVGLGVLYARSTWWGGLGAEVHGWRSSTDLEGDDVETYATYNLFVGARLPR